MQLTFGFFIFSHTILLFESYLRLPLLRRQVHRRPLARHPSWWGQMRQIFPIYKLVMWHTDAMCVRARLEMAKSNDVSHTTFNSIDIWGASATPSCATYHIHARDAHAMCRSTPDTLYSISYPRSCVWMHFLAQYFGAERTHTQSDKRHAITQTANK